MIRNIDNLVEVATPIYDKNIQKELKTFLEIQFKDNVKARILNKNQDNTFKEKTSSQMYRAQDDIYDFLKNELENSMDSTSSAE